MASPIPNRRFEALQIRDFRIFWFGQGVSSIGTEMQKVAIDWNVFQLLRGEVFELSLFGFDFNLDGGALGLGAIGLVRVVPIMLFALLGGILADVVERQIVHLGNLNASGGFARTSGAFQDDVLALATNVAHVHGLDQRVKQAVLRAVDNP